MDFLSDDYWYIYIFFMERLLICIDILFIYQDNYLYAQIFFFFSDNSDLVACTVVTSDR